MTVARTRLDVNDSSADARSGAVVARGADFEGDQTAAHRDRGAEIDAESAGQPGKFQSCTP